MGEWKRVKLGEICSRVCSGGTPRSNVAEYYDGGSIPWLNTKEVTFGRIYSTEKCITESGLENSSAKWIEANAVVVAMYGATAGNVAITRIPLTTNQACCNLQINLEKADADFVFYYLKWQYHELCLLANGAAQQNLNAQVIKDFQIGLPDLPTQRRIAAVLGALDDKIEVNRKICENLEAQAQALFKAWFVDFEPFGGKRPEGWKMMPVEELTERMASGGTPKTKIEAYYDGTTKWFSTKELKDCFLFDSEKHISKEAVENSAAKVFPRDTVLMAIYAAPTVGRLGIMDEEGTFNQAAVGMVAKKYVGYPFLFLTLLAEREGLNLMAVGSCQQNLNVGVVRSYKVLLPDEKVLSRFNESIMPMFDEIRTLSKESRALAAMRDALLPKLMSGELAAEKVEGADASASHTGQGAGGI